MLLSVFKETTKPKEHQGTQSFKPELLIFSSIDIISSSLMTSSGFGKPGINKYFGENILYQFVNRDVSLFLIYDYFMLTRKAALLEPDNRSLILLIG